MSTSSVSPTYYIVRHGHTFATKLNVPYGSFVFSAKLLPESYPALHSIGKYLQKTHFDYFCSSEISRCRETASILEQELHITYETTPRLNEFANESIHELADRVRSFLAYTKKQQYTSILIVTHGAVIACLKHLVLHDSFSLLQLSDYSGPETLAVLSKDSWKVMDFSQAEGKHDSS